MFETIEYETEYDAATAHVRLDRPEKLNAISPQLSTEYVEAVERAEADDEIRAIVVSGNGEKAFSAGHDLNTIGTVDGEDGADPDGDEHLWSVGDHLDFFETEQYVRTNWECNKPVIAAVQGYCLAMGTELALSCDIVIATDDSTFGFPGVRMGGTPPNIVYPFVMNLHEAKELLLSGKIVDADRAEQLGMVNRVVPRGELWGEVDAEVDEIRKMPGQSTRILKHVINGVADMQGARPTFKYAEMFDTLAHHTEGGKEYYRIAHEEGIEAAIEHMNEADKGMR